MLKGSGGRLEDSEVHHWFEERHPLISSASELAREYLAACYDLCRPFASAAG
jgi:hypothetical protein